MSAPLSSCRGVSVVEALLVLVIAGILAFVAIATLQSPSTAIVSRTNLLKGHEMLTVRHSGHLWVVHNGGHATTPVHHPDCPCLKAAPAQPAR